MAPSTTSRLAYIDWMRGLACVLMFQTHCYDAWLNPESRKTTFFMWSQVGGTLPAPLFLFLAGISVALVANKLSQKGSSPDQIGRTIILRGAEILGLGFLFRLQEYLIAWGWSPWSDLLRVDILNTIGLSMMLMGVVCWIALKGSPQSLPRKTMGLWAGAVALLISLLTPLVWTVWRPQWMPWPLESYFDGVHNLGEPQSWLFPVFPWTAFAFTGLSVGFFLLSDWVRKRDAATFAFVGVGGVGLFFLARCLDRQSWQIYPVYDFWHTSPSFFLMRAGLLLMIMATAYVWCRWGAGQLGFSPLIQLGQTSLLVYWVHIEFVYGRVSILPKKLVDIRTASFGLLAIFVAMVLLSMLRTRLKGRGVDVLGRVRGPATAS
jgi:uncharacterized membrane protein